MNILDLIPVPDEVEGLGSSQEGLDMLRDFHDINRMYPDFFPAIAKFGGVGAPLLDDDGASEVTGWINEGKRRLALEVLSILAVAEASQ